MAPSKKSPIKSGSGRLIVATQENLSTGSAVDRDAATFERLYDRLKAWNVKLYCTDDYNVYNTSLPVGHHYIGKDQTYRSEQNNSRQRHWFTRFRRKSLVVSRSLRMINATLALFAALHVNRDLSIQSLV